MSDSDSEPVKVRISEGVPVIWHGGEGLEAATVLEIDGDFVRVGGSGGRKKNRGDHWLRVDDIVAVGVYGDEPGLERVVESREDV